ncbi:SGNH/GDSL hydrolase family protein [Actinotalea sp. Marseille-Q4924]|uniref:SGNH/GDSL hydrolase family protein n=1 Tax=Actinotalea sp. Marseille-Q4924 TaxID=2866571 RepID=UPI001CE45E2A|nr:SGNH/GDSL hydrolase family protein [Actinotalea sp. Marseille-Q4924]
MAAAVGAGAAVAAPPVPPGLPVYLVLGDSIAAGQGSVDSVDMGEWLQKGYAAQIVPTLQEEIDCLPGLGEPVPAGCKHLQYLSYARPALPGQPGVTTDLMLQPGDQVDRAVALLEARNQDRNPRNDVEVILLTVGGNEALDGTLRPCLGAPSACGALADAVLDDFEANYGVMLDRLRDAAGEDVVILTTAYYNPLPYCGLSEAFSIPVPTLAFLGGFVLEGGAGPFGVLDAGLNTRIRDTAAQYGADTVETSMLGPGDFADCKHPNGAGHAKIAAAFADMVTGG